MLYTQPVSYAQPIPPLAQSQVLVAPTLPPQVQRSDEPEEPAPQQVNCQVWALVALYLLAIAIVSATLIFGHTAKLVHPEAELGVLDDLAFNLKQTPWEQIKPKQQSTRRQLSAFTKKFKHFGTITCDAGFEQLTLGTWYGVTSGCLCTDGKVHKSSYCALRSSSECSRVNAQDPIPIKVWDGFGICAKKSQDFRWAGSKGCGSQKACDVGVCVTGTQCPVNKLDTTTGDTFGTTPANKFTASYDASIHKMPFVLFQVSPGASDDGPCFSDAYSTKYESQKQYPLYNRPARSCAQLKKDNNVQKLANRKLAQVVTDNSLTQVSSLPFYSQFTSADDTVSLYAVRRFQLGSDKVCDEVNPQTLETLRKNINFLHVYNETYNIVIVSVALLTLLLALVLFSYREHPKVEPFRQTRTWAWIAVLVALGFLICSTIYLVQVEKQHGVAKAAENIKKQLAKDCFVDEPIKLALKTIEKYARESYSSNIPKVIVGIVFSGLFLLLLPLLVLRERSQGSPAACTDPWRFV